MSKTNRSSTCFSAVLFFGALLLAGCPGDPGSNNSGAYNASYNTNSAGNQTPNANFANTNSIINTNANQLSNIMTKPKIDQVYLTARLKERLQKDDINSRIKAALWNGEGWLGVSIGLVYENKTDFIHLSVREITDTALALNDKKMTEAAREELRESVTHETTCKKVVEAMHKASINTKPLNQP